MQRQIVVSEGNANRKKNEIYKFFMWNARMLSCILHLQLHGGNYNCINNKKLNYNLEIISEKYAILLAISLLNKCNEIKNHSLDCDWIKKSWLFGETKWYIIKSQQMFANALNNSNGNQCVLWDFQLNIENVSLWCYVYKNAYPAVGGEKQFNFYYFFKFFTKNYDNESQKWKLFAEWKSFVHFRLHLKTIAYNIQFLLFKFN